MTRFLFWNLHRQNGAIDPIRAAAYRTSLTRLARDRAMDVLVFARNRAPLAAVTPPNT